MKNNACRIPTTGYFKLQAQSLLKPNLISFLANPAHRLPDEAVRGDPRALRDAPGAQLRGRHAVARAAPPHTVAASIAVAGSCYDIFVD